MKPRIRWSDMELYQPIRLIIKDWSNLRRFFTYMTVDSIMEYKDRLVELCVPYRPFINKLRNLPLQQQKWIVEGKAVIELMKTYRRDRAGMVILNVEKLSASVNE